MYGATVDPIDQIHQDDPQKLAEFEARIARGEKIEPGDWMPVEYQPKRQICGVS
jgi:hypothetical protein